MNTNKAIEVRGSSTKRLNKHQSEQTLGVMCNVDDVLTCLCREGNLWRTFLKSNKNTCSYKTPKQNKYKNMAGEPSVLFTLAPSQCAVTARRAAALQGHQARAGKWSNASVGQPAVKFRVIRKENIRRLLYLKYLNLNVVEQRNYNLTVMKCTGQFLRAKFAVTKTQQANKIMFTRDSNCKCASLVICGCIQKWRNKVYIKEFLNVARQTNNSIELLHSLELSSKLYNNTIEAGIFT